MSEGGDGSEMDGDGSSDSANSAKSLNVKEMIAHLNVKEMIARKRAELAKGKVNSLGSCEVNIIVDDVPVNESNSSPPVERTFEGGFFSIKSPVHHNPSLDVKSSPKSKSTDKSCKSSGDRLRRSVLSCSGRRLSGLVSPYVSQLARRVGYRAASLHRQEDEASPEQDSRRSSLFENLDDDQVRSVTTVGTAVASPVAPTPPQLDMRYFDPSTPASLCPLQSQSTSHNIGAAAPNPITWSTSSEEEDEETDRGKVRFTPLESAGSPTDNLSCSAERTIGTPHTKSGKKLNYERDDSCSSSPGLRRARVSLLPIVSDLGVSTEGETSKGDKLILLDCSEVVGTAVVIENA